MTPRNRMWSLVAMLVSLSLIVSACQAQQQPGPQPTAATGDQADPNAELVTNMGSEPDTIDPHKASFVQEINVILSVFEGLMTLDTKTLKPTPAAAAAMPEISADGLTWKVTLKDGLKWSDGSPLTAQDYVRGFKRTCDPRTHGEYSFVLYVIVGCEAWFDMDPAKASAAELTAAGDKVGVRAVDAKTIEFKLSEPAAYFSSILYMWVGMPVKQESLDKGGDKWTEPATYIGNGPFKLVEWKHNEKMVFEKNENFREPVKLKRWTKVMINEGAVAFAAYRNNELDVVGVAAEDLRTIDADAELKGQVVDYADSCTFYAGFNVNKPPFDDPKVRLAFAKALDRETFVKNVVVIGKAATAGFIPPGIPGYDETDNIQAFDAAAAKKLLSESKYANAPELSSIKFTYSSSARTKTRVEFYQQSWKNNLGIEVALDPVDSTAFTQLVKSPATTPQLFSLGWCADFPDQQNWHTTVWISKAGVSAGRTGYNNPEFDKIVKQADGEKDNAKRDQLYLQAGKILSQDAPAAWVYYSANKILQKPWVKGIERTALNIPFKAWEWFLTKKP